MMHAVAGAGVVLVSLGLARACETRARPTPTIEWRTVPQDGPQCHAEPAPEGPWPDRLGVLIEAPPTREERTRVVAAIDTCGQTSRAVADPWLVLALGRLEDMRGVPVEARGILAGVWCVEASMRTEAARGGPVRGDIRDGVATAHGPMQQQSWMHAWCGMSSAGADDLLAAGDCWLLRVESLLDAAREECGAANAWRVAEAMTSNPRKYGHRKCAARTSKHWAAMSAARSE